MRRPRRDRCAGFTMVELSVVVIILAIIAYISIIGGGIGSNSEQSHNAQLRLTSLLNAEKRVYAWKSRYSDSWSDLAPVDPNTEDPFYRYAVTTTADGANFTITASRQKGKGPSFRMDRTGTITSY